MLDAAAAVTLPISKLRDWLAYPEARLSIVSLNIKTNNNPKTKHKVLRFEHTAQHQQNYLTYLIIITDLYSAFRSEDTKALELHTALTVHCSNLISSTCRRFVIQNLQSVEVLFRQYVIEGDKTLSQLDVKTTVLQTARQDSISSPLMNMACMLFPVG